MAASGYTPIQLYYSTTASAVPSAGNLASGELAINITDGKLYFKNNSGTVTLIAGAGGAGIAAGSNTQIQFNSSGSFGASSNLTWDGTTFSTTGLTASSTVTLSGGTANGVAYLNGSKVVTSGSALTFDGTNLATTGGVRLDNAQYYYGKNAAGSAVRLLGVNSGNVNYVGSIDSGPTEVNYGAASTITAQYWNISGSEQMRLTSTGLGIGTSSPNTRLTISSSGANGINLSADTGTTTNSGRLFFSNGTAGSSFSILNAGGTLQFCSAATPGADTGTTRLTLDSSGNLGLGVTPSAWSTIKALQVGYSSLGTLTSNTYLNNNTYYNGTNWIYSTTAPSGKYQINDNVHSWHIAPSGTAGATVSFTQAMTLTSGGNLQVGGTTGGERLNLENSGTSSAGIQMNQTGTGGRTYFVGSTGSGYPNGAGSLAFYDVTAGAERMTLNSSGNLGLGVTPSAWGSAYKVFQVPSGTYGGGSFLSDNGSPAVAANAYNNGTNWKYVNADYATIYQSRSGQHQWFIAGSGSSGSNISFTQAMTLTAAGNLLIGTTSGNGLKLDFSPTSQQINGITHTLTSPESFTDIYGCGTGGTWQGLIRFFTSNNAAASERARIDSSGNLLVGTTSANGKLAVSDSSNPSNQSVYLENTNTGFNSRVLSLNASRNVTSSEYQFLVCSISGIESKFIIQNSGNAQNRNNSYGAISDAKLKENVIDATPKLDDLMRVRVRHYNFKSTPQEKQIGVVAQELEQVFPAMIDESPDKDAEGNDLGTTTKAVKYSVFVPMLIKAMQEQQAIIESLKARLDAANL